MTRHDNELLDAIWALTKPRTIKHLIGDKLVSVTLPPLFDQLDTAITSSMGGTTPGGSDPSNRSVANDGALMRLIQISSQVGDWARMVGSIIDKQSNAVTLERWYVKHAARPHSPEIVDSHTGQLVRWAGQIEALLDPPKEMDFAQRCPSCSSDCWFDTETKASYPRPLILNFRPGEPIENARGRCRACKKTWGGREMAYELEVAEMETE